LLQIKHFPVVTGTIAAMSSHTILKVAVSIPIFGLFDYKFPKNAGFENIKPGCRVEVPFGRKSVIGMVIETSDKSEFADNKLKTIKNLIDEKPILPTDLLKLLNWSASYYQYPLGEVVATALPKLLREGRQAVAKEETLWKLSSSGSQCSNDDLKRAPKQASILKLLQQNTGPMSAEQLNEVSDNWRTAMQGLIKKHFVEITTRPCLLASNLPAIDPPRLNDQQQQAVDAVSDEFDHFQPFLLQGITGSGKTEVYLSLVEKIIQKDQQVLILVPEISLTPQLTQRFQQRLNTPVASMHSGLNDSQRLCAWVMASENKVPVVIGTRSALFTPMPKLGLIIIDEEHDSSLKQMEGFRYHARDLALVRAKNAGIPILLGSATPSLESLNNANKKQYKLLPLTRRAAAASPPKVHLLDVCRQPMQDSLSNLLLEQIHRHLNKQGQILLFLNRRGYAPLLMCHACGWTTECPRCDAHMTLHHHNKQLRCHHCGQERHAPTECPDCGADELHIPGAGTERIEHALKQRFPDTVISRIDRDTTRRKGELDNKLEQARSGEARILIGTQMLAKGHDFPNVTLVGILDTDQGLFSSDFRGTEHMAQLIIQVSGRAGRAEKPGEVYIQTHHPEHPLLHTLLNEGYEGFAKAALEERQMACFPPFAHLAVLRSEAIQKDAAILFLQDALNSLNAIGVADVDGFGPLPAPMERRAGRYRAQLIIQSRQRNALHTALRPWVLQLGKLKSANRVRWSIDVDPQDMY
jgi:primosomal protein N' (replication factor Y) (superfamily II helicase)